MGSHSIQSSKTNKHAKGYQMKALFTNILNSFKNDKDGFSARKLTAFGLMGCIVYIHKYYVTSENATEMAIIDLCGVLIALGIVTAQNIIELKNGKNSGNTPTVS